MATVVAPIVHLNGTSRADLSRQFTTAYQAMIEAVEAAADASPNERDYYLNPGSFAVAMAEHRSRMERLSAVRDEFLALAIGVDL